MLQTIRRLQLHAAGLLIEIRIETTSKRMDPHPWCQSARQVHLHAQISNLRSRSKLMHLSPTPWTRLKPLLDAGGAELLTHLPYLILNLLPLQHSAVRYGQEGQLSWMTIRGTVSLPTLDNLESRHQRSHKREKGGKESRRSSYRSS